MSRKSVECWWEDFYLSISTLCCFSVDLNSLSNKYRFLEEEEVDKMMEQKMKEEEERKRTKEIEERMSLEETKEQVGKLVNFFYV